MAWPAVNEGFNQEGFREYVSGLMWNKWRPSGVTWHNTAAPSIVQWMNYPDQTRINNLIHYWQNERGWSGCPHLVISPREVFWVINPLTAPGIHSPSFNNTHIGIEMVGDFSKEDDEAGLGAKVKRDTIFATAVLCGALGLDPKTAIQLHKEDPRTTHDCPGEHIARDKMEMVLEVEELVSGGEHDADDMTRACDDTPAPDPDVRSGTVTASALNFRSGPGINHHAVGLLPHGTKVEVLDDANSWLRVRSPAGYVGWVASRYVEVK